jgi:hypothetical protein
MGEVMSSGEPNSPQGGRGHAGGWAQQSSEDQQLGMELDPVRKAWCKGGQHPSDRAVQGWHRMSSFDSLNVDRNRLS